MHFCVYWVTVYACMHSCALCALLLCEWMLCICTGVDTCAVFIRTEFSHKSMHVYIYIEYTCVPGIYYMMSSTCQPEPVMMTYSHVCLLCSCDT